MKESLLENKSAYQSRIISKIELSTDVSLDHVTVVPELSGLDGRILLG